MKEEKVWTVKEAIKLYFGETKLSDEESRKVDEALQSMNENGFKEKCHELVSKKEKSIWHIGRFGISKVACMVAVVVLVTSLCGFTVVMGYLKRLHVVEHGDHSEVQINYDDQDSVNCHRHIETYYEPVWIPDGYNKDYEYKGESSYSIIYVSNDKHLDYQQYLPNVKYNYGAEIGKHFVVAFGRYSGEFIETEKDNYLIVTDGIYVYSVIAANMDKNIMIKMLQGE